MYHYYLIFLVRYRMNNNDINNNCNFNNIEKCSGINIGDCSLSTECTEWDTAEYKCCLPIAVQPSDHPDICMSSSDVPFKGTGPGKGDGSGPPDDLGDYVSPPTNIPDNNTIIYTTTTQSSITQPSTTQPSTTQPSNTQSQQLNQVIMKY